jgi:hypothetical protein
VLNYWLPTVRSLSKLAQTPKRYTSWMAELQCTAEPGLSSSPLQSPSITNAFSKNRAHFDCIWNLVVKFQVCLITFIWEKVFDSQPGPANGDHFHAAAHHHPVDYLLLHNDFILSLFHVSQHFAKACFDTAA